MLGVFLLLLFVSCTLGADCTSNKCQNGGVCTAPRQYDFICVGEYVIYGVTQGKMYIWGQYSTVISGTDGNPIQRNTVAAVNISAPIAACSAGLHNALALDTSGNVWSWGTSYNGEFWALQGNGPDYDNPAHPTKVLKDVNGHPFTNIVSVGAGGTYVVAVNSSGTVFVWGNVAGGLGGDGNTGSATRVFYYPTPINIAVQTTGSKIIKVSAGAPIIALANDGTMYTWGNAGGDGSGNLGWNCSNCPNTGLPGKVAMPKVNSKVIDVLAGGSGVMYALTQDGTLFGWGVRGQFIGVGDGIGGWYPLDAPTNLTSYHKFPYPVRQIASGQEHSVVILTDGSMWAWGSVINGEVGNGQVNDTYYVPHAVKISLETDWYDVYSSPNLGYFTFAQTNDGRLFSWGRNKGGPLGNGLEPTYADAVWPGDYNIPTPEQVDPLNLKYVFSQTPYHCVFNHTANMCSTEPFIPTDLCNPSHCQAGTRCILLDGGKRFTCDCSTVPTLTGLTCNITKAAVIPSTGYSCSCPSGFGGQYCQYIRPPNAFATTPAPTPAPTHAPTTAPTPAPTHAPTPAPTHAPTPAPPTPVPTQPACPSPCPSGISGAGSGLTGFYYSDMNFGTLKGVRIDTTISFDWGSGSPGIGNGFPVDNFSVRWKGTLTAKYTGLHTFVGSSDDGERLYINGAQVFSDWSDHAAQNVSGTYYLVAGHTYSIVYEYYEDGQLASASLSWSLCNCMPQQIIPMSQLTPAPINIC